MPKGSKFVFTKDTGGDEWFQLFLSDGKGGDVRLTEPGTRNLGLVFTPDGKTAIWGVSRKGDPDTDIVAVDLGSPGKPRTLFEGTGAVQPLDVSADGKTVLFGRYISITESKRYLLDIATGKVTEIAAGVKTAYDGGRFLPDGKRIMLLSDKDSDTMRLVEINLATGAQSVVTPGLKWDVEAFDISKDGRLLAYSVNEDGYSIVHLQDLKTRRALAQPALPVAVLSGLKFSGDGARLAIGLSTRSAAMLAPSVVPGATGRLSVRNSSVRTESSCAPRGTLPPPVALRSARPISGAPSVDLSRDMKPRLSIDQSSPSSCSSCAACWLAASTSAQLMRSGVKV